MGSNEGEQLRGREVLRGKLNQNLLPMVKISVEKCDGDWQELDVLCDTGVEGGLVLPRGTLNRHGIAVRPDCSALGIIDPRELPGDSISGSPYWVDLLVEEGPQRVEAESHELHRLRGLIGTKLMQRRRLTVDVKKKGAVSIDRIPSPPPPARLKIPFRTPEMQSLSCDHLPLSPRLPWVDVTIQDIYGREHVVCANVDTGNNGELTLPPNYVEWFGFRLPSECLVNTIDGEVKARCGKVQIVWQGCHRTVECIRRDDVDRPIVGMKLFSDTRITIDFEITGASLRIAPISSKNRLYDRFAGLLRWSN